MANSNWLDDLLDELVPTCPQSPKQNWGQSKEAGTPMDKGCSDFAPSVPNVPTKNDRFVNKSADIVETQRERRRLKVLAMLADRPETQRAIITDMSSDPDNVILAIGLRDQYTVEMTISKDKYDPFMLLELIDKGSMQ